MRRWSFYDLSTGLFIDGTFSASTDQHLAANTPKGCAAIPGTFDRLAQRVDLETGAVVAHTPPPPSAAERRELARHDALQAIEQLEAGQQRAMREAVLTGDASRLQAIDRKIAALRAAL